MVVVVVVELLLLHWRRVTFTGWLGERNFMGATEVVVVVEVAGLQRGLSVQESFSAMVC